MWTFDIFFTLKISKIKRLKLKWRFSKDYSCGWMTMFIVKLEKIKKGLYILETS